MEISEKWKVKSGSGSGNEWLENYQKGAQMRAAVSVQLSEMEWQYHKRNSLHLILIKEARARVSEWKCGRWSEYDVVGFSCCRIALQYVYTQRRIC